MNSIELSLFASRIEAICEEMGAVLRHVAFSPNIKDRLDYSCAVFDEQGRLCAQAAHIPVHLGSMAYAMRDLVRRFDWRPGDMVLLNDPYAGGTHLPDVTLIAPCFTTAPDSEPVLAGFVTNRAHHADIGGSTPGSMPLSSSLDDEGLVIAPVRLLRNDVIDPQVFDPILAALGSSDQVTGDFLAQISANRIGLQRLVELITPLGGDGFRAALARLNDYAATLAQAGLATIPDGCYRFTDYMDDDGLGHTDIPIQVAITVDDTRVDVDFSGTAPQAAGNINCPLPVTAAAVYYVFRCLMPAQTPACDGSLRPVHLSAPAGCLLNARYPAAVAAGNVETSTRIVDVILGALATAIPDRIPAASHGSMNNVAMGAADWDYYETIGGGMGANARYDGLHGVQTHMTNTRNTPIEILEMNMPLRIRRYALRRGSGGNGLHRGGDGLLREFEFLQPTDVTLLTERRTRRPWGLNGGEAGQVGSNTLNDTPLPGKVQLHLQRGDRLTIATAGAGGWGGVIG